jgi:hypothetical protein
MKKNVLTLGDSFTYGDELSDVSSAWPIQLGDLIKYRVVNLGRSGNSNHTMISQLIEYIGNTELEKPDLVVIGWSSPGRIEFADEIGKFIIWPGYSGHGLRNEEVQFRQDLLNYINAYNSSEYQYETFIHQVILAQHLLKSNNIPYVMCNTVGNEYYANLHRHKFEHYHNTLIDTSKFAGWPKDGMAEWTRGCKRGPRGHFLEDGHKQVANKIYEHIRHLGWLS